MTSITTGTLLAFTSETLLPSSRLDTELTTPFTAWDTGQANDETLAATTQLVALTNNSTTQMAYNLANLTNPLYLNVTNTTLSNGYPDYVREPRWAVLPLILVIVLGLAANISMITVVSCSKGLQAPFAVLSALAVGDILKALTVMPMSMVRLLLGGYLPGWLCRVWTHMYLSCSGLTLTHLAVALLHCHLTLNSPSLCFHNFSNHTVAAVQITTAWILSILLTLPYGVYSALEVTTLEEPTTCSPVHYMYFSTGVLPAVLIPAILAGFIYVQVLITIGIQRRAVLNMAHQEQITSDVSSNGFVTYENSEASSDHSVGDSGSEYDSWTTAASTPNQHRRLKVAQANNGNGHVIQHDAIVHDNHAMPDAKSLEVAPPGIGHGGIKPAPDEPKDNDDETDKIHSSGSQDPDIRLISASVEETSSVDEHQRDHTTLADNNDKNDKDTYKDAADCAGVNLVMVKTTKMGKESLNTPLGDNDVDDVQLHMLACALTTNNSGVSNPSFQMEDSDMPLSESIKPRSLTPAGSNSPCTPSGGTRSLESLNVDRPNGLSRTSSCSGDENGTRSILKWDRAKRSSTKSVTFSLPPEEQTTEHVRKPRLLSCKYKIKNGQRIRAGGAGGARPTNMGEQHTSSSSKDKISVINGVSSSTDPVRILQKAKEALAKTAEFHYINQAHKDQRTRLRSRVKRTTRLAKLLLALLIVSVVCTTPYVSILLVVWFNRTEDNALVMPKPEFLIDIFEWLGFLPYIVFPFMYAAFSVEFRKALKSIYHRRASK